MKITDEKFKMLGALFARVDLKSLISHEADEDIYDEVIRRILTVKTKAKMQENAEETLHIFKQKNG